MGKDLKAKLSLAVYTALNNIKGMSKELGGGRSKKAIDSSTEYIKLAQLLAGNGDVSRDKMTKTDIETLESELANAEKWKPVGDELECTTKNNTETTQEKETEKCFDTQPEAVENKGAVVQNTDKKPAVKKPEKEAPESQPPKFQPPKSLPPKRTQVQNNNFNNSGVNNSFNNNSGTIIIDRSIHIGETKTDSTKTEKKPSVDNTPLDKTITKKKEDTVRANKENYQVAYDDGAQVATDLIGYTTTTEKTRAIRNIMKQNENTIIGFMQGYYSEDNVKGIPYGIGELLDQVDNEYGWTYSEKTRVFTKIIETTLKYAENTGSTENSIYKELAKLLKDLYSGKGIDTETADAYIKELIMAGAIDVNS